MDISKMIKQLGEVKSEQKLLRQKLDVLKQVEADLKADLQAQLDTLGLKSVKGERYQASMATKSDIVVTHEPSVVEWLKQHPEVEYDAYVHLDKSAFKTLAKQVMKTTGEVIPGSDTVHTQYLSIKENK